ncbi:MAG TPA: SpoIIE family protein phosphatase [Coriobacteriia bacterium]|jgi:PAS domain S-box-containing protein
MGTPLRVLLVEDSEDDALLLLAELERGGFEPVSERVDNAQDMLDAVRNRSWDVVVSDYVMPSFGGLAALELLRQERSDTPFIIVSGQIGEDVAVEAMRAGADDYATKSNLQRLVPAIRRELRDAAVRRGRAAAEVALAESEERWRRIVETAMEGIWLLDADAKTTYVNRRMVDMLGYSAEEMLGKPEYAFADETAAADVQAAIAGAAQNPERRWDVCFRHRDGHDVWALVSATARFDESGRVAGHLVMLSDITERKVAERDLRMAYHREHHIADVLQRALLLDVDMDFGGYRVVARYQPALEESDVGGDFYDVFELAPERLALAMGDVSGKGLSAAVHTAMAKYMTRAYAHEDGDPAEVMRRLNSAMYEYTPAELFVTLFYGVLDSEARTLTYCDAGHDLPFLCRRATGEILPLEATGPLAGAFKAADFECRSIELGPGDLLLVYTDGITDARGANESLGVDGLTKVLRSALDREPVEIIDRVFEAAFSAADGKMRDDAAVFVLAAPTA